MRPLCRDDVVTPRTDAFAARTQMRRTGQSRLMVLQHGGLLGILSFRDLLHVLLFERENMEQIPASGTMSGEAAGIRCAGDPERGAGPAASKSVVARRCWTRSRNGVILFRTVGRSAPSRRGWRCR
jgi:hypothetical protein